MSKRALIAIAFCAACVSDAAPLNEREASVIKSRLVPAPQSVALGDGPEVALDSALAVTLACAKEGALAERQVRALFKAWFGCKPKVAAAAPGDAAPRPADA